MIITRSPFRYTLGGGGTDLPSYYSQYGGFVLSAAIDKYMYINVNRLVVEDFIRVKYSRTETVTQVDDIQHDIVRHTLKFLDITKALEISSQADVPAGTGLGSSSCYTVGLLSALHTLKKEHITTKQLADEACYVEIELCKKSVGKQDQFISAFGGVTAFNITQDGQVTVEENQVATATLDDLQHNTLLFYTGISRSADAILTEQSQAITKPSSPTADYLHRIKEIGYAIYDALKVGNVTQFGLLTHEHWLLKQRLSSKIANNRINELYELARENGAIGGKITGAGGGGFFVLYVEEHRQRVRQAMTKAGLQELRYNFDFDGSKVIANIK